MHDLIDAVTDSARKLCRHDETAKQLVQHAVTTKAFRKHFHVQETHLMRLVDAYKNMTQRHLKSVRLDRQVLLSTVVGPYPDGTSYLRPGQACAAVQAAPSLRIRLASAATHGSEARDANKTRPCSFKQAEVAYWYVPAVSAQLGIKPCAFGW